METRVCTKGLDKGFERAGLGGKGGGCLEPSYGCGDQGETATLISYHRTGEEGKKAKHLIVVAPGEAELMRKRFDRPLRHSAADGGQGP